jgi:1,5-anhydro-D-fructose reductase (1,5-anhydro-D-mannitol-forming)
MGPEAGTSSTREQASMVAPLVKKRTIGWGIVGLGRAADTMIAPAVSEDPNGALVAVVSRDQRRAEAFASKHGAGWAGCSYEAMLLNPLVDIVMITTPNGLHPSQVIQAAGAGKHVVCDKPLALTAEAAREAFNACEAGQVRCGLMFESRQMDCFLKARRLIADGALGRILLIQADFSPGKGSHRGWRADPKQAGMGAVLNLGVHTYDLLRFLLAAEVTQVTALFDHPGPDGLEKQALVLLRFSNGTLAYVNANEVTPMPINQIVIHGSKGRLEGQGITSPGKDGEMRFVTRDVDWTRSYAGGDCWAKTIAGFSRALLNEEPFSPSAIDGLRSAELTDAIAASATHGVVVDLPS